jgi:HSP20 family protein
VEEKMARKEENDLLMADELTAAFLNDDENATNEIVANETIAATGWEEQQPATEEEDFLMELAVDVYETTDKLVVKARTAGVRKEDLRVAVSTSDQTLTITGKISGGEETDVVKWHIQECYWGEFSKQIKLPVDVSEEGVDAVLRDGILTITLNKVKTKETIVTIR